MKKRLLLWFSFVLVAKITQAQITYTFPKIYNHGIAFIAPQSGY